MFKKGLITDEVSQDFKTAAQLAKEYGLDGVEIRSVNEKAPHELDKDDIKNIKSVVDDFGLEVCGISAPFFKCDIDNKKEIEQHIEIFKRSVDLANSLNAKFVRGFTFWNKGNFDDNIDKIVDQFDKPISILNGGNVKLVLEFDPSVNATNAKKLVKILDRIDSDYVKGLWDPGNDIYDPDGEKPYPDGYRLIKPYMVHMHLKDAKIIDGKAAAVPVGDGDVDYKGHFNELLKDNYNGYVVLETHYRPKAALSDELLALPKGSIFSYMGYEASEECLKKWNILMDNL